MAGVAGLTTPTESSLVCPDGVRLFYRFWRAAQPRAVCLIAHGIAEHSGRYHHLAQALLEIGLSVWAPDHRGHGRSEGRRGDCETLDQLVEDLGQVAELARAEHPRLPQVLVGHSLGGLIALAYAVRHPETLRAVAASAPALKLAHPLPPLKVKAITALSRVAPLLALNNGVNPATLSHDARVVEAYRNDPLVHRVITARCAVALDRAMQESPRWAGQLKVPCLILQGGADEICDAQAVASFARSAPDGIVTFRRYEGLYHELFNEPEKGRVITDLCEWFRQVLRPQ